MQGHKKKKGEGKMRRVMILLAVIGAAQAAKAGLVYEKGIEYAAGAGENKATIVIDFDAGDFYLFEYRWDGQASGWDALSAIDTAALLSVDATWYEQFQSHFVNDFGYPGGVKYDYGAGAATGWGYWGSGDGENWLLNGGVDGRMLTNGGWDGWVWSNYDYSVSWDPIRAPGMAPEPGTILLLGAGAMYVLKARKNREK